MSRPAAARTVPYRGRCRLPLRAGARVDARALRRPRRSCRWRRAGMRLNAESAPALESAVKDFHVRQRVDLAHVLVGTQPKYSRKAQRVATIVPVGAVDHVERDLDDDVRLDHVETPYLLERVLTEIRRHLRDLLVREPAVRLANRHQPVA